MQAVCFILSGLALLAAIYGIALLENEKERNEKRRAAMVQLQKKGQEDLARQIEALKQAMENRLRDLEAGVIPDYEAARQAAEAVDEFNQGLSNILGFDPMTTAFPKVAKSDLRYLRFTWKLVHLV